MLKFARYIKMPILVQEKLILLGQAPISIHSLTASDAENAPRGISFDLDTDRLNVAISRAQCLSIVVGSPNLAKGLTSTVDGVIQLNRLCRIMAQKT